jgi:phosphatidylinositol-3-phosphatase
VKPGTTDFVDSYNHFSLLGTLEKMLGLPRLGFAADPGLPLFGPSVFNNYFG